MVCHLVGLLVLENQEAIDEPHKAMQLVAPATVLFTFYFSLFTCQFACDNRWVA